LLPKVFSSSRTPFCHLDGRAPYLCKELEVSCRQRLGNRGDWPSILCFNVRPPWPQTVFNSGLPVLDFSWIERRLPGEGGHQFFPCCAPFAPEISAPTRQAWDIRAGVAPRRCYPPAINLSVDVPRFADKPQPHAQLVVIRLKFPAERHLFYSRALSGARRLPYVGFSPSP